MWRRVPARTRCRHYTSDVDFGKPDWCSDAAVASKSNGALPKSKRSYFDSLPAKVIQKHGELSDVLVLQPNEVEELVSAPPQRARALGRGARGLLPGAPNRVPGGGEGERVLPLCSWPTDIQDIQSTLENTPSAPSDARPSSAWPRPCRPKSVARPMSARTTRVASYAPGGGGGALPLGAAAADSGWRRELVREASGTDSPRAAAGHEPVFADGRLLPSNWRRASSSTCGSGTTSCVSDGEPRTSPACPAVSLGAGSARRTAQQRRTYRQSVLAELHPELHSFFDWTEAKFGHLVTLWHKLDQDESMTLRRKEFFGGMKALRYEGDLEELWTALDSDRTGVVTFTEFVPEHALELARFKHWCLQKFGSLQSAFRALDLDGSGWITLKEFSDALDQNGFESECVFTLFLLLDSTLKAKNTISEAELLFLDRWQAPAYLYKEPDYPAKERFKSALLKKYRGNALRAWRKILDKDSSMRVAYGEFSLTCKELERRGFEEAVPKSGVAGIFAAFDQTRSGWFALLDWDAEAHDALLAFAQWARGSSGRLKVADRVRRMAPREQKGLVDWDTFKEGLKGSDLSNKQIPLLFDGLCPSRTALSAVDVSFLDKWDSQADAKERALWCKLSQHRTQKSEAFGG